MRVVENNVFAVKNIQIVRVCLYSVQARRG